MGGIGLPPGDPNDIQDRRGLGSRQASIDRARVAAGRSTQYTIPLPPLNMPAGRRTSRMGTNPHARYKLGGRLSGYGSLHSALANYGSRGMGNR